MTASLSRIQARHWGLVGATAATASLLGGPGVGGILLGGGALGLSVFLYALGLRLVLRSGRPRLAIGVLFVKLAAFLGLGWLAFASGRVLRPDPIGFALGLSCFPAAAVWEAMAMRERGS